MSCNLSSGRPKAGPCGSQGAHAATTWTSYNKPASITQGSHTISFLDDPEHQRSQQVTAQGKTLYFDSFGVHAELVVATGPGKWNEYLTVGDVMVGVRFLDLSTETVATRYFHTDHLGSVSVITDETGNVLERLSYDAWGKRRYPNGAGDPAGAITSQTTRGFTAHEELGVSGLVYDPLLGRMMSADPNCHFRAVWRSACIRSECSAASSRKPSSRWTWRQSMRCS